MGIAILVGGGWVVVALGLGVFVLLGLLFVLSLWKASPAEAPAILTELTGLVMALASFMPWRQAKGATSAVQQPRAVPGSGPGVQNVIQGELVNPEAEEDTDPQVLEP
ncbi:hypothetical protein [Kitasatospora sp. NPDC005856]|uniref:hypothetical protein n=1 Tax=Kitasatospora sp. NPDC005856 TaxID=3154566 RepID=UPI0033D0CBE9